MKKFIGLSLVLLFFSSHSQALDVGLGVKAGINGIGLDFSVGLTKTVNLRLMTSSVDIDDESESIEVGDSGAEADLDAELEFDYGANALLLDWHVFNGGFRVTAGLMRTIGDLDLTGTLEGDVVLDGEDLSPDDILGGDISGGIELADSYQPYVGIGWGRGAGGDGGFSFSADLGVAMVDPGVDLDAAVNVAGTNNLTQADLDRRLKEMENDAEDDLDELELWPVLMLGINYAF